MQVINLSQLRRRSPQQNRWEMQGVAGSLVSDSYVQYEGYIISDSWMRHLR